MRLHPLLIAVLLFVLPSTSFADGASLCSAIVECGLDTDLEVCLAVLEDDPGIISELEACLGSSTQCAQLATCMSAEVVEEEAPSSPTVAPSGYDMTIRSRTSALETEAPLSQGELRMIDGSCGIFLSSEAIFYLCGEQVVAGPLTTEAEVQALFAQKSAASKAEHDLTMGIINNMPSGRSGGTKVQEVDSNGNVVREYYE